MARPEERMRLKDKIIDNISKAIKSIQSHHFYQAPGSSDRHAAGFTLGNVDKPCHKLCENLDHAFLHGLKNVTHGYWPVVKQLSHKGMIKEIEMLINVTTDLGRGRAWLYASLNEGLLESYLRMLDENEKLVKKYYAKEALLLDHDRLNLLLTLITGLECVTFQLDFDQPYLDLNAYPPRGRSDSELEESVGLGPVSVEKDRRISEMSLLSANGTPCRAPSDSDSSSLASVDVHPTQPGLDQASIGPAQQPNTCTMRTSTISSDSGFPTVGGGAGLGEGARSPSSASLSSFLDAERRSITPTGVWAQQHRGSKSIDTLSVSSVGSSGDPDRMRRVEHILTQKEGGDEDVEGTSLEVIRVKSKRASQTSKGKKKKKEKERLSDGDGVQKRDRASTASSQLSETDSKDLSIETGVKNSKSKLDSDNQAGRHCDMVDGVVVRTELEKTSALEKPVKSEVEATVDDKQKSIPQADSGVDIHSILVSENFSADKTRLSASEGTLARSYDNSKSAFAQIENKIAELFLVPEENLVPSKRLVNTSDSRSLSDSSDITKQDLSSKSQSGSSHSDELLNPPRYHGEHLSQHATKYVNQSEPADPSAGLPSSHDLTYGSSRSKSLPQSSVSNIEEASKQNHHDQKLNVQGNQAHNAKSVNPMDKLDSEDDFDFYAYDYSEADQGETTETGKTGGMSAAAAQITNAHAASHLEDYMDFILQGAESPPECQSHMPSQHLDTPADLAVDLDNNTKLQVMLDIFTQEHEKFIKMFATRENHTEGESTPVFVVISDHCLYILHYKRTLRKFALSSCANLVDLIFVSTGLNNQTLNIESREKNKQKQRLWLTPGHQNLTQAILDCLTDAVKAANEHIVSVRSRFSVGSEVPLQKIAIRKYISKELDTEAQDVTVGDYSLVFWEDPSSDTDNLNNVNSKEGTLLLRSHDAMKGYVWKPVYVVLKDSMLCVSNHKTDIRPHSYLGLGGDQCVGCRLVSTTDRPHCVELVLSSGSGGSWFLSAASEQEISEWRHSLCLAVSQGMQDPNAMSSCIPCCAVLSCNQLFMCHEDLQTKFFRTLGRAQLEDVTGISVDPQEPTYCILEFESQEIGVSSVQWVLYFAATIDRDRHTTAMSSAWKEIYKVDLPISRLDNVTLLRHCRSYADILRKQLALL